MPRPIFEPYDRYREYPPDEMLTRAVDFRKELERRRTIRDFSDQPVSQEIIKECLRTAGSAPSGANF